MTNKTTCKNCDTTITESTNGEWLDNADSVECDYDINADKHEPAPEVMNCEDCGNEIAWDFSNKSCERCVEEYEQQMRDQVWDYYHA